MRISPMLFGMGVVAAFVAGSFIASPELRAYAANTVGSGDIINNSIQSVDIKDEEIKTADLAQASVTNGKIKDGEVRSEEIRDGTIQYADISRSAMVVEHRDDCNCGGTGWDPNGTFSVTKIYDSSVTPNSAILITIGNLGTTTPPKCFPLTGGSGSFWVTCDRNIPQSTPVNYAVFNHP